jgi:hypothetical protein
MEPEAARRHINYIEHMNGLIGVGDGWRPTPSGTSPASIRGESFHQTQTWGDGTRWWTAIDYVRSNPGGNHVTCRTGDLPTQGTFEAMTWGIHANVGTPGKAGWEPWHAQPIEHDGWLTWVNGGRKRPAPGYPIPGHIPPLLEDDDMIPLRHRIPQVQLTASGQHLVPLNLPDGATKAQIRISMAANPSVSGWVDVWSPQDFWKNTAVVNYTPTPQDQPVHIDGGTTLVGVNPGGACFVMASSNVVVNIDVQGWA